MKTLNFVTGCLATGSLWCAHAQASSLSFIPVTPGFDSTRPLSVSNGGKVVGWQLRSQGASATFSWDISEGTRDWISAGLSPTAGAYEISSDGTTVVGSNLPSGATRSTAFRRIGDGSFQNLGVIANWQYSRGTLVSTAGETVVGRLSRGITYPDVRSSPFIWTPSGGMRDLGKLAGAAECEATALSGDGATVVGWSYAAAGSTLQVPLVWRNGAPLSVLPVGTIPARQGTAAWGTTANGRIIVGTAADISFGNSAIRWVDGVPEALPRAPGFESAGASAISDDGRIILGGVGRSLSGLAGQAYLWHSDGRGEFLVDYWASYGIHIPNGWNISLINGMSRDGNTFIGELKQGTSGPTSGFIVVVPAPASGLFLLAFAFRRRRRGGQTCSAKVALLSEQWPPVAADSVSKASAAS